MSTYGLTIRRAVPKDAAEIARLADELGYPMPNAEMERRLECLLPDDRHCIVVASAANGRLIAWMHIEHRTSIEGGDRAELMGLVVDATARRSGIGRRMMDAAESWALAKGLPEVTVRSNTARSLSHPFYERLGYVRTKTQHVYRKTLTAMPATEQNLLASSRNLKLGSAQDAMDIIFSGLPGCIITPDVIAPEFFDLRTGLAGEVFQKFINFHFRVAIVVPANHGYGERITELAREHARHAIVRIVETEEAGREWLMRDP